MLTGSDFRHHPAVFSMDRDLGRDDVTQYFPAVFYHSRSGFITAALNSQNINVFILHSSASFFIALIDVPGHYPDRVRPIKILFLRLPADLPHRSVVPGAAT